MTGILFFVYKLLYQKTKKKQKQTYIIIIQTAETKQV